MARVLVGSVLFVLAAIFAFSIPLLASTTPTFVTSSDNALTPRGPPQSQEIPYHTILRGWSSGYQSPANLVVNDQATWDAVWAQLTANCIGLIDGVDYCPDAPQVDFSSRTVLAVFLGERLTTGYWIDIVRVEQTGHSVKVQVRATEPGPYCGVGLALTHPFRVVDIPKTDALVTFSVGTVASKPC